MTSLFIFHRDLRTVDNLALSSLSKVSDRIIPIFVFTPTQIDPEKNKYYNSNSVQFMCESLLDLYKQTGNKLTCFYGDLPEIVEKIIKQHDIEKIGFNLDYTPYAKERTEKMRRLCNKYNIECITEEDYTLVNMSDVRGDQYYSVFKPYYDKVIKLLKGREMSLKKKEIHFFKPAWSENLKKMSRGSFSKFYTENRDIVRGGRENGIELLKRLLKNKEIRSYDKNRNTPSIETTHLSAYIKYGTVSIREVYHIFKKIASPDLIRQLIWHDFYAQIMYYLPEKQTIGGGNFKNKKMVWENSPSLFKKWCEGRTGFPIVDAGMRQLNTTGWMHNRLRLITSNFLSLILGIDWRKGEKYFAQKLVDYDVSSNNGNWQFTAQVGIDRVPYLRIYNPFTQAKEVDPKCIYIKKWVKELREVDNKIILGWDKYSEEFSKEIGYPLPIIDYSDGRKKSMRKYGYKR